MLLLVSTPIAGLACGSLGDRIITADMGERMISRCAVRSSYKHMNKQAGC